MYGKKPQSKQPSKRLRMSVAGNRLVKQAKKSGIYHADCDKECLRYPMLDAKLERLLANSKVPFWQNYRTDYGTRHFISKEVFSFMGKPVRMAIWIHKSKPDVKASEKCGDWRLDDFYDVSFEFQREANTLHPEADGTPSFDQSIVMKKDRVHTKKEAYDLFEKYLTDANLEDIKLVTADKANALNWRIIYDHCAHFGLPLPAVPKEWRDNWQMAFHTKPFFYPWQGTPNYREPWDVEFTAEERKKQADLAEKVISGMKAKGEWK